ncbi:MAG: EF-hand domain-containing protein [Candidatus Gastranaerophilaceae bacterium]
MSGFSGINQFGSLTTQSGQRLTFKDFDKDGDGKITQEEYDTVMNEMKLDSVELSSVDKNGDKEISEDEFAQWEQKTQMQTAVNDMAGTISKDFAGKTQYLAEVTTALKEYIEEFAASYTGDISGMAEAFKAALPAKYEEIKSNAVSNDPDTVKSNVLDEIYTDLTATKGEGRTEAGESMPAATAKRIAKELEAEADKFIKGYNGENLQTDLKAHLEEYMNKSDAEKLKDAADAFNTGANSFGAMIDNGADLKQLKEYAKEFLLAALDKGVTVKLGGTTIKTEAAITTALKKFSDGDELKAAMEEVIAGLNTETLKNTLIKEEEIKAQEAADKAFTDIKGDAYKVDASLIDYSGISGYYENTQIHERGKGWGGSRDKAYAKGEELLTNESLKSQMKAQLQSMLEEKGISFDKIANIFENVYTQSVADTLNAEGMITGRGARGFSSKGHAYLNTKDCVDAFINTFNTNIAKAIDEMNGSNKDMDLWDIDYTQAVTDENGNIDQKMLDAIQDGDTVTRIGRKEEDAEKMIDRLQSTMLMKAKAMCDANGVEFDLTVFNTMFNNAKSSAVAGSIETKKALFLSITTINPQNLIKTFTTNFKDSYTVWVNAEAAEAKNKK